MLAGKAVLFMVSAESRHRLSAVAHGGRPGLTLRLALTGIGDAVDSGSFTFDCLNLREQVVYLFCFKPFFREKLLRVGFTVPFLV